LPAWLFRMVWGKARVDRPRENRRLIGRAAETVEFGPFVFEAVDE
jgi:hypothetical protein